MILDDAGKESTSSQPDNWEMKPAIAIASLQTPIVGLQSRIAGLQTPIVGLQSRIAGLQTPIVGLPLAIAGLQTPIVKLQLQPLIDVRNPHVVRRHVAIVIAAHNHFPAHFDFIDRSKKSAEVRMSEVKLLIFQKELPLIFRNDPL